MPNSKKTSSPPALAIWFLKRLFPEKASLDTRLGDFTEAFTKISREKSRAAATAWLWINTIRSMPYGMMRATGWHVLMLYSNLKITQRHLRRHKTRSMINIVGLSIGLASSILIFLFVRDEFSFDGFHENAGSIHSVFINDHFQERSHRHVPIPMAPVLQGRFAEIEDYARLVTARNVVVRYRERVFNEIVSLTDPQFLTIFSFPMLRGQADSALSSSSSVVLTQAAANRYFGDEDPTGKSLLLSCGEKQRSFEVSGIAETPPENSTIKFSILLHLKNLSFTHSPGSEEDWTSFNSQTFLLTGRDANVRDIEDGMLSAVKPHLVPYYALLEEWNQKLEAGETITFGLQKIRDMHLHAAGVYSASGSRIGKSFLLAGIALLILFIAVINFINMSIAGAASRASEIGVRKVLGAERRQLIRQFWTESIAVTAIACMASLVIIAFLLPVFNTLSGKSLSARALLDIKNLGALLILVLSVGLLGGSFPAAVLANFKITDSLFAQAGIKGKTLFTRILVILQFSLSVFLLVVSMIMSKQIGFLNDHDLGFQKDNVLIVDLQERETLKSRELLERYKDRIQSHVAVTSVSGCMSSPNRTLLYGLVQHEEKNLTVYFNRVHFDYLKTMKMKLRAGRDFSDAYSREASSIIINQKLADELGFDQPIGQTITMGPQPPLTVIGVVDNFNYLSLEQEIGPAALNMDPTLGLFHTVVRIAPGSMEEALAFLENGWKDIQPDKPFSYSFLDEDIAAYYSGEEKWKAIVSHASALAVLIAGMGIFGLMLITTQRRIKEIGIRKILGASIPEILKIIMNEFLLLILLADVFAWPIAWFVMHAWLQNFAYRSDIGVEDFLIPGLITAAVALLTSCGHAIRAAAANPIDSLRYE